MEQPPHPMRLGDDEKDYYLRVPGTPVPSDVTTPAAGATASGAGA
jgi:NADH-quinone oxidoreductase subunit I